MVFSKKVKLLEKCSARTYLSSPHWLVSSTKTVVLVVLLLLLFFFFFSPVQLYLLSCRQKLELELSITADCVSAAFLGILGITAPPAPGQVLLMVLFRWPKNFSSLSSVKLG
mgnify:CR=1 FL=1